MLFCGKNLFYSEIAEYFQRVSLLLFVLLLKIYQEHSRFGWVNLVSHSVLFYFLPLLHAAYGSHRALERVMLVL